MNKYWLSIAVIIVCWVAPTAFGYAAYDFVQNSDFQQGLAKWKVMEGKDATVGMEAGAVTFKGMLGSVRHGIYQPLDVDAGSYSSLLLRARVKVDEAKLPGTGLNGDEAPISLFVVYTDAAGIKHTETLGSAGRFWHGFYYEAPVSPAIGVNGEKIERGVWFDYQLDLMTLNPPPKRIHEIGAEGSGWARRSASLMRLSLIAPEEGHELVKNPSLEKMAAGWLPCVDFKPTEYQADLVPIATGIQLKSSFGDKRVGLMQNVEADVSRFSSLLLTAEVKVDAQRLGGTGYNGREAPLALFVTYTDELGIRHDQLPLAVEDTKQRMVWQGLYIMQPQPPASAAYGLYVQPGEWQTICLELMKLEPRPKTIHSVGVESAGRSPRDASVRRFSVKGR